VQHKSCSLKVGWRSAFGGCAHWHTGNSAKLACLLVYTSKEERIELCEGIEGYFLVPEFVIEGKSVRARELGIYKKLVTGPLGFDTIRRGFDNSAI